MRQLLYCILWAYSVAAWLEINILLTYLLTYLLSTASLMSDSVTSAPVCDSRSSFCGRILPEMAPTSQHLALRNMTNIEHRSLFQLLQNLRARYAEGLGKWRPDASRLHAPSHLRSCENRVLSSNNSANTGVSTARPTAPCSTPARDTLS